MYRKALDWDQVRTFMKKISAVLLCGMISLSASASDLEDLFIKKERKERKNEQTPENSKPYKN